jgi:AcrR family transcriptional regulator
MKSKRSEFLDADPSPRVARRRERMRSALLAAASRQFASRGVSGVSVEQLIAEADVSRATFYRFFNNKYNLLETLLNPIFELAISPHRLPLRGLCASKEKIPTTNECHIWKY